MPTRKLASMLVRFAGRLLLVDCGEGTQVAIRESGWSLSRIDMVCITHFHADHIAGLPGLLLTMGACGRTEPVTIAGPLGLEAVVGNLRSIAPFLPYETNFIEFGSPVNTFDFNGLQARSFALKHLVPCFGYSFSLPRAGRFDAAKAKTLGIPLSYWSRLQKGETVEVDGKSYFPSQVLGPERRGIKLAYCTDTSPTNAVEEHCADADLLILEATNTDGDNAVLHGHMTFAQAAKLAAQAGASELLLTHFSPSISEPAAHLGLARSVFSNTSAARDLMMRVLSFVED